MNPSRIVGMSLSVNAEGGFPGARSGAGDFRLEIDWIKALRTQKFHQLVFGMEDIIEGLRYNLRSNSLYFVCMYFVGIEHQGDRMGSVERSP
ncbi:hypothetical protein ACLOJK_000056 [Asimina triloba]